MVNFDVPRKGKIYVDPDAIDETGEEIAARKRDYTHTRCEDLEGGCPIGHTLNKEHTHCEACFTCEHTDRVGFCVHPVNIDNEIKEGRARPLFHNPSFPELEAHYKLMGEARAFRAVDKR